jgi:hypothetical protein
LSLCAQQPKSIADSLQKHFSLKKENLDPIEGIWDVFTVQEYYHYDTLYDVRKSPEPTRISVTRREEKFISQDMNGAPFEVEFTTTDVKRVYMFRCVFPKANDHPKPHAALYTSGSMELTYDFTDDQHGGKKNEGDRTVKILTWKKITPLNK